jgi:hypothetical protein
VVIIGIPGGEAMQKTVVKAVLLFSLFALCAGIHISASASDWPFAGGDFYEITGVKLKDGGDLAYAKFLATEWKADQEFAKSKGWIKSYSVLGNNYPRKGEPDLYLVIVSERLPSGSEGDKRQDEYLEWKKKSTAQLAKESGNRLEIREIETNSLLQEWKFR